MLALARRSFSLPLPPVRVKVPGSLKFVVGLAADFSPVTALAQASGIRAIAFNELSYRVGSPYCEYFRPVVKVHQGKVSSKQGSFAD